MQTNIRNESDSPIGNLTHQPCVTDESAGRPAGVSTAQQSYGGKNVSAPRRPWRFAPRGAALFVLAVFWLPAALQAKDFPYIISNGQVSIVGYTGPGGHITIPESIQGLPVTRIAEAAFVGPVISPILTGVTIPNSVIDVGGHAFAGCTNLASVTIPNSVTFIGSGAFQGCTSLASIMVEEGNSNYSSLDGVLFNKDRTTLIQYPGGKSREYAVPKGVTSIGDEAFSYCASLASVTIPNSVTSIGGAAFDQCTSLASLTLPDSVTFIGDWAFRGCASLASVTIPNSVTSIGGYAFAGCTRLASVTIPNSVTSIGGYGVFAGCTSLASVTIPNSVTSIGPEAFSGCTSLVSVTIPNSVTGIADFAFNGCTSLASVTIPNSVIAIARAFQGCTNLASVTVGNSVTGLGFYMFRDCTRLRSVYFMGNAPVDRGLGNSDRVTVYYRAGTTGWRPTFSGRPAVLWIPEADLDRDGLTNQQEFLAGSDPADAQSLLAFEGTARLNDLADEDKTALSPGQFALYFQSIPGQSYEIQFTETLGAEWRRVATTAAGRATQKRVVLDRPATNGFYQLKLAEAE